MNWKQIKDYWNAVSNGLRLMSGKLSNEDIIAIASRRDHFAIMLQKRYRYATAIAYHKVDKFA